ncbi:MAG: signal peptidase II [Ignavibacteriales bacterium]|nr:signal peptidase II [Ignavibacteriales bacterium]
MKVIRISAFIVLIDQITKIFVKGISIPFLGLDLPGMQYGSSINVIGDLFKITFVENPGMAFGINVGGYAKLLLSLFSLVASIGIIIYIYKVRNEKLLYRVSLALILGGAVGNLIDRFFYGVIYGYAPLLYGRVVDFLHFNALGFTIFGKTYESFPIFNVADSAVTIGVAILLIFHKSFEKKEDTQIDKDLINTDKMEAQLEYGNSNREDNKLSNN